MKKTKPLLIKNAKIYTENSVITKGSLLIKDGKISEVGTEISFSENDLEVITLNEGEMLVPGFIDLHIHGAGGADTMDATSTALQTLSKSLPAEGTTSYLATTITQSHEAISKALENAGRFENQTGQAELLGIHLEGPFISPLRAGAQPKEYICSPLIEMFQNWEKVSNHSIKLVTLAPEEKSGLELINYLAKKEIVASIGHSDATESQMRKAITAGAQHVTHLYNGMRGFHHREPGVAGTALTNDELFVELICDGIHAHPSAVKLAYLSKGAERLILITDAMRAKGLQNGTYDLGGQSVFVENNRALLEDGTLAGSILKMNEGMKNLIDYTGCSIEEAIKMTSLNSAKQLKIDDKKGSIAEGKDADLVVLTSNLDIAMTFCRGELAFQKGETQR